MDGRERVQKLTRIVRKSVTDLFDQSRPFGRLALVHTLMSAGSTVVTVGLAGTLFFSISLKEAESKVLLYLLITIAPFAVVAPALSPLLDRGRQARRSAVVVASGGSALVCLAMVRDVKGLLLFPEAFGILVLSKLYLVARAALVPAVTAPGEDYATANAQLAVLSALAGFAVAPIAVGLLQIGASVVMGMAAVVFLAGAVGAFRLPKAAAATAAAPQPAGATSSAAAGYQPGGTNGMPGAVALPGGAGAAARPGGAAGYAGRAVLTGAPAPAALGPALATAGAVGAAAWAGNGGEAAPERRLSASEARAGRRSVGLNRYHPTVLSAFTAMCVVRGAVGFVTFFLAFALKRENAAAWWYGFIVLASGVGGLSGSMLVPRVRRRLSEERIILASLVLGAVFAICAALIGGMWAQPLLTFVIGLAGTTSKPSFDSLVQREVPALMQGRAFARFETWLQLAWVMAALLAVLVTFQLGDGDVVVAVACGTAACFYASMRSSMYHRHPAPAT